MLYRSRKRLSDFAILVPSRRDLARLFVRLAEGWQFEGASDHLVSEALYLRDPDGHGIEIYADRQRTEWRYYGNSYVRMATLPLNINSLLQELRDEGTSVALSSNWTIPKQTKLGRIHLHVSRLEKAEKFYRQILGFDVIFRLGRSAVFFSAGGYHHHIGANVWAGLDAQPLSREYVRLESFAIWLGSRRTVSEFRARLVENGLAVEGSLLNGPEGYEASLPGAMTETLWSLSPADHKQL